MAMTSPRVTTPVTMRMTDLRRGDGVARADRSTSRRARWSMVAAVVMTAATVGCSGADESTSDEPTVVTLGAAAEATTLAPEPAAPTTAAPPATVAIDAPAMLQQALDAVAAGYHFRTAVTVDGTEVLTAEGERVGDGTRLTIAASGSNVSYVITPAGSWVLPEGGEWEALDSAPATTDPLLALRSPTAVVGTSTDGVAASLVATVSAASLGVPSDGAADVRVNVTGGTLVDVSYEASVDGRTAVVQSVFSAVQDPTPVTAPI